MAPSSRSLERHADLSSMKNAANTAEVGTLGLDEQTAAIDSGFRKVGSLKHHDVIALRTELDWLNELEHPWGPFPTYQRHLEYLLSQYDAGPAQNSTAHGLHPDRRKG
jgi:hypothetical protein